MSPRPDTQMRALVEAGMVLASELDLDSLLQRIADIARDVLEARYAAVGVLTDDHDDLGTLQRFVYSGIDHATADLIGDLPRGRGVLGVLTQEGRPLRVREIGEHPKSYGFPAHHPPMHSFLGVPITVRGRVFGRLYLTEKIRAPEFTKDDERIAHTLASQAGIAIENARLYEEVRKRREELAQRMAELASVERVASLLITERSIDELLLSAAEEAMKLSGAVSSVITLHDEATGEMVVRRTAGAVPASLIGARLPARSSKAEAVMSRMTSEVVDDLSTDDEVHTETMRILGSPKKGAFVPLIARSRGIGAIAVYDRQDGDVFSSDDLVVLQLLANQVAIALENDRLTEALQAMAILEERERISKELHDGVIQSIYSVGLALQGSISMMERDPAATKTRLESSIAELDNVVRDVRSYIFELRPKLIEERGFEAAVRELVKDFEVNTLADAELRFEPEACSYLSPAQEGHVVQIVREILSNIARHAQSREIHLSCSREGEHVVIEIRDDGKGFDPMSVKRGQGLGNIEERAGALGGRMEILPAEPRGTRHILQVPIQEG